MEPISRHNGIAAPLPATDVNTDLIFPQRYLRKPDRNAMEPYLFRDLRFREDGSENPDFILNREPYTDATVLIAGRNVGSGSSREHAPWALRGFGFRVIISSVFADIFKANCINNGIIPAIVSEENLRKCLTTAANPQEARFDIDLEAQTITHPRLGSIPFEIRGSDKERLLKGHDFVDETLAEMPAIESYERAVAQTTLWRSIQRDD